MMRKDIGLAALVQAVLATHLTQAVLDYLA